VPYSSQPLDPCSAYEAAAIGKSELEPLRQRRVALANAQCDRIARESFVTITPFDARAAEAPHSGSKQAKRPTRELRPERRSRVAAGCVETSDAQNRTRTAGELHVAPTMRNGAISTGSMFGQASNSSSLPTTASMRAIS
jgi:hypothetical protein